MDEDNVSLWIRDTRTGKRVVFLTATSSVDAFVALRTPEGAPLAAPAHVVCIGPTTEAAARAAGLSGVHEAWGASAAGIVAELADHFGRGASSAS